MSLNDWYPFNPIAYRRDTYHLNVAQHGIYRALIDEYMLTGKPLPDHDASLAGIARATAAEWDAHKDIIRAFFKARDGKLIHSRCERELHAQSMRAAERSKKAKEAATIRWVKEKRKQWTECYPHAPRNADAMLNDATLHNKPISLTSSELGERLKPSEKVSDEQKRAANEATKEFLAETCRDIASPELRKIMAKKTGTA